MLICEPVDSFLCNISSKSRRVIVVHDPSMSYSVQDVSSIPNAASYIFNCISALSLYCFVCLFSGVPINLGEELVKNILSFEGTMTYEIKNIIALQPPYTDMKSSEIHNTSKVMKASFLICWHKVNNNGQLDHFGLLNSQIISLYILWNNNYIFRYSNHRDSDGIRLKQKEVHMENGHYNPKSWLILPVGFMSHCGWNSCIESITMGVPVVAWPMHSDQPNNGFLVIKIFKIGLILREWDKRRELISPSTIENVVRKLMESEEGDVIRKRAEGLGEAVRRSTKKQGSSRIVLDYFIIFIKR
uniref:Glycosyltransferase N-terminal domain-containing protein n=1 Tax=Solanum lycopersicum TaxID=4081 RepID=A0A3Q7G3G3_SOLLC